MAAKWAHAGWAVAVCLLLMLAPAAMAGAQEAPEEPMYNLGAAYPEAIGDVVAGESGRCELYFYSAFGNVTCYVSAAVENAPPGWGVVVAPADVVVVPEWFHDGPFEVGEGEACLPLTYTDNDGVRRTGYVRAKVVEVTIGVPAGEDPGHRKVRISYVGDFRMGGTSAVQRAGTVELDVGVVAPPIVPPPPPAMPPELPPELVVLICALAGGALLGAAFVVRRVRKKRRVVRRRRPRPRRRKPRRRPKPPRRQKGQRPKKLKKKASPKRAQGAALAIAIALVASLAPVLPTAAEERGPTLPAAAGVEGQGPQISGGLLEELSRLSPDDDVNIIVHLREQPWFPPEMRAATRGEKVGFMKGATRESQASVIQALEGLGATVRAEFWIINSISVTAPAGLVDDIASLPGVGLVDSDPQLQLFLDVSRQVVKANVVEAEGYDGSGVKIGLLDTGVQDTHPWLQRGGSSVVVEKWDATVDPPVTLAPGTYRADHGTETCGVIASQDATYKGVAPGVDIVDICVQDTGGSIYASYLVTGIQLAVDRGCDIASVSIGGHETKNDGTRSDSVAFDRAFYYGLLPVVAIGNEGPSTMSTSAPGDGRQVISVAALDDKNTVDTADDGLPSWAQQGPSAFGWFDPDVIAPGVNITMPKPVDSSATASGTSFSTPAVAGVCALVKQRYPTAGPEMIKLAVVSTAKDAGFHPWAQGAGRADASAALSGGLYAGVRDWAIYRNPAAVDQITASEMTYYPFWNAYIQPGHSTRAEITLFNYTSSGATLSTSYTVYPDYDNSSKILSCTVSIAPSVVVPASSTANVAVTIDVPTGQAAGTWPVYVKLAGGGKSVVVPVCLTVLLDLGAVSGYLEGSATHVIDDYYKSTAPAIWGDTFAFGVHNSSLNETSVDAILGWTPREYGVPPTYQNLGILLYNAKRTQLATTAGTGGSLTVTATTSLDTGIWWITIFANANYEQGFDTTCTVTAREKSGTLAVAATARPSRSGKTLDLYASAACGVDGKLSAGTISFTLYRDNGDLYWDNAADTATAVTGAMSYNAGTSRFESVGVDTSSLYESPGMYYAWCAMTDAGGHGGRGGGTFFAVENVASVATYLEAATTVAAGGAYGGTTPDNLDADDGAYYEVDAAVAVAGAWENRVENGDFTLDPSTHGWGSTVTVIAANETGEAIWNSTDGYVSGHAKGRNEDWSIVWYQDFAVTTTALDNAVLKFAGRLSKAVTPQEAHVLVKLRSPSAVETTIRKIDYGATATPTTTWTLCENANLQPAITETGTWRVILQSDLYTGNAAAAELQWDWDNVTFEVQVAGTYALDVRHDSAAVAQDAANITRIEVRSSFRSSAAATYTMAIYNWATSGWEDAYSGQVGTTEVMWIATRTSGIANYVGPADSVRVRLSSTSGADHILRGDYLVYCVSHVPPAVVVDITLSNTPVEFGTVVAGAENYPALENKGFPMVITVESTTTVNVDIYLKGDNWTSAPYVIGVENCTFDDDAALGEATETGRPENTLAASYPGAADTGYFEGVAPNTAKSLYFFIDIPDGQGGGAYAGTIFVKACKDGTAP